MHIFSVVRIKGMTILKVRLTAILKSIFNIFNI